MRRLFFFFFTILSLCTQLTAEENYKPKDHCFTELSTEDAGSYWLQEYKIGAKFAAASEYQNAIHCFKRALFSCSEDSSRISEIEYAVLLAQYFDHKYSETIQFFESHSLLYVDKTFKAYHDLMIILYHCYEITKEHKKADLIMQRLEEISTLEADQMKLTGAIIRRDFSAAKKISEKTGHKELLENLTEVFLKKKKSQSVAKWLNIFVPGLGYFYLGQRKAALTSFLLNGALVLGTVQLFMNRYYAIGSIMALVEIGWYAGGIVGAKHSTYLYNESLFTNYAEKVFYQESLLPENKLYYEF